MICRKCKKDIPDESKFCLHCGSKQEATRSRRQRGNGTGTAYKVGDTWTVAVTLGWKKIEKDGKKKTVPVRTKKGGFKTKREALAYAPTLQSQKGQASPTGRTFADYWELWSENAMLKLSPSKQTAYNIAHDKLEKWMYRSVVGTGVADLQAIVNEKATSYYTARDMKSLLSHLYKLAIVDQVVTVNLPLHIELPTLKEKEPIPFNEEEIKKLWADYAKGERFSGYLLVMMYSGMMPGELFKAKKDMIDWDKQQIVGCGLKTKERKATPLVIADFIVPVLRDLCAASETDALLPMSRNDFYTEFRGLVERLGFRPELTAYSCRHTTATALALGNIAPSVIQKAMRHAKFSTTQRYIHPDTSDILQAVNKLNGEAGE